MSEHHPAVGTRVTVKRYEQPTMTPGDPKRRMVFQVTGTLAEVSGDTLYFETAGLVIQHDRTGQRVPEEFEMVCTEPVYLPVVPGRKPAVYLVTETGPAEERPELYRHQVAPDLAVVADGGAVVLEVTDGLAGHVLRRVSLSHIDEFKNQLDIARTANQVALAEDDERRLAGLREVLAARRARGQLDRREAVSFLVSKGMARNLAANAVRRAQERIPEHVERAQTPEGTFGVSYDRLRWRIAQLEGPSDA